MAHFAQLDENNVVTQIIVVANNEILLDGVENETKGVMFCKSLLGEDTRWVQTSYNATIRKNYASIGSIYDPVADHFFTPQPYPSWTLDADAKWQAPTPTPLEEGKFFTWDEPTLSWVEVVLPA